MSKTISIVVPIFNEAGNIPELTSQLLAVFEHLSHDPEIVFVNDGSRDNSDEVIKEIIKNNQKISGGKIKYFEFSRNFGKEMAVTAGLNRCWW